MSTNAGTALKTAVTLNPLEWIFRAVTGTPSPLYDAAQNLELRKQVADAGGGQAAQDVAVAEQSSIQSAWGARGPLQSIVNTVTGNPLGVPGASTDWLTVAIVAALVLGSFYLFTKVIQKVV